MYQNSVCSTVDIFYPKYIIVTVLVPLFTSTLYYIRVFHCSFVAKAFVPTLSRDFNDPSMKNQIERQDQ